LQQLRIACISVLNSMASLWTPILGGEGAPLRETNYLTPNFLRRIHQGTAVLTPMELEEVGPFAERLLDHGLKLTYHPGFAEWAIYESRMELQTPSKHKRWARGGSRRGDDKLMAYAQSLSPVQVRLIAFERAKRRFDRTWGNDAWTDRQRVNLKILTDRLLVNARDVFIQLESLSDHIADIQRRSVYAKLDSRGRTPKGLLLRLVAYVRSAYLFLQKSIRNIWRTGPRSK